jgi:hypothetical protein
MGGKEMTALATNISKRVEKCNAAIKLFLRTIDKCIVIYFKSACNGLSVEKHCSTLWSHKKYMISVNF